MRMVNEIHREIEKDKAKDNERRRRKDGASVAAGGEEPLHGTVRHIQTLVSGYIDSSYVM